MQQHHHWASPRCLSSCRSKRTPCRKTHISVVFDAIAATQQTASAGSVEHNRGWQNHGENGYGVDRLRVQNVLRVSTLNAMSCLPKRFQSVDIYLLYMFYVGRCGARNTYIVNIDLRHMLCPQAASNEIGSVVVPHNKQHSLPEKLLYQMTNFSTGFVSPYPCGHVGVAPHAIHDVNVFSVAVATGAEGGEKKRRL